MHQISILDSDIVFERPDLIQFIDYWKRVLNIEIGWHYDIDIVWILQTIEALKLPLGSTIMDAGAGNGLIQFLLAAKGYKVLSVDFSKRVIPAEARKIFNIEYRSDNPIQSHRYQSFINHSKPNFLKKIKKLDFTKPLWTFRKVTKTLGHYFHFNLWKEILQKNNYGSVTYVQADFSNISSFSSNSIDCIISVSAIEHNDPETLPAAIREFERLLKPGGSLIVTTSASKEDDKYLEYCQGWCFSAKKLRELFSISKNEDNYQHYDILLNKLIKNELIRKRIPSLYFENGDNGLPWGKYPPQYQPVGIHKTY